MDVTVVNRPLALLVMLVTLAGPTLAGEPTPVQRTNRGNTNGQPLATKVRPTAVQESSRKSSGNGQVIGAGVRRAPTGASKAGGVQKASANSRGPVVRASSQVVDESIVYESSGDEYIDDGMPMSGGSSCNSCGDGGCDGGDCGASCGTRCSSGWGGCGIDLCNPGGGVGRQLCICLPSHGWAQMDYLMWWQDGMNVPPLLTTSPSSPLTARDQAGVLRPGSRATVLLGNDDLMTERRNGGRIRFGWWFANRPNLGLELEYFGLNTGRFDDVARSTSGPGAQILARPFFNLAPELLASDPTRRFAREDAELIAYQGVVGGSLATTAFSTLDGAAVRFRRLLCCSSGCALSHVTCGPVPTQSRIDATLGWRFFQLREGLNLVETLSTLPLPAGAFRIEDDFRTRNQFNGVELGVLWQGRRGYWSMDSMLRCSVGNMRQEVSINGNTIVTPPGGTALAAQQGGFFAQQSNIGTELRDAFAVVPELGATIGYQCTQNWRLTAGYTFIYLSNVVRPGDQIDRDLNPNQFPSEVLPTPSTFEGAASPRFDFVDNFRQTDFWVQGVNLGAEYRW